MKQDRLLVHREMNNRAVFWLVKVQKSAFAEHGL